ncbi:MAG: DUF389 domain-containing protein, partial [Chloroflexi bacterium]|nr:DUF389 domain-containing protein [Chloroflexota bacterium]
ETGIEQEITPDDTEKIVAVWLRRHGLNDQGRTIVTEKLFIEGPEFRQRLGRFAVLMGLATVIATFGVATGSTAVVIGGMLIAPLMMPILALSAALLHGWTRRAVVASLVVLGGVAGTTLLAFLLARAIPDLTAVLANDQVLSRTSPSLLDLAIAVAAGTAGAYAVTRPDVSDALPGVAVAISLVPPLTVAGVTLQGREFGEALGALLLFATNLVSILVMASIVFLLTGYVTWERVKQQRRQLRSSYATVAIGFIVVTAALAITGQQVLEDAARTRSSESIVEEWLGVGSAFQLISIDLDGGDVNVSVRGEGDPPPAETLHRLLVEGLSDDVVLRLRVLPETLITIGDA